MQRDTEDGKNDYTLALDGPMFERWVEHLTKGAQKYDARNWMQATGEAEYQRFQRSLLRHLFAYLRGERDEDHAAAIFFNVNGMEYVRDQLTAQANPESAMVERTDDFAPGAIIEYPAGEPSWAGLPDGYRVIAVSPPIAGDTYLAYGAVFHASSDHRRSGRAYPILERIA
jgi:hypothetical protein